MPVRSGPTLPPSPEWVWHLAHCCLKTTLPRGGVAALQDDRGQGRRSPSGGRGRAGRRPWRAGPWPGRRWPCRGWAARACFWSSESSDDRHLARLDRRRASEPVQSVLPSSAGATAWRAAGRHRPPSRRRGPSRPRASRSGRRRRSARWPASGGVLGVTQGEQVAGGLRVALAEVDRAAARRRCARLAAWRRRPRRRAGPRRAARREPPAPFSPSAQASPRAGRASRSRASAAGGDRLLGRVVELGRLVLRPALAKAGDDRLARPRVGLGEPARSSPSVSIGPPAGVVLGDARRRRRGPRRLGPLVDLRMAAVPRGSSRVPGSPRDGGGVGEPAVAVAPRPPKTADATAPGGVARRRHPPGPGARRAGRAARGPSAARLRIARRPRRSAARPATAFRRTAGRRDASNAAFCTPASDGSAPSSTPRPCSVQRAWIAAGIQADRVDATCPARDR